MISLSVIIPSRNELFLSKTVDDIFSKAKGSFEVIVVCDERMQELAPRSNLIVLKKVGPVGMRGSIHQAVNVASGKFILKTDAHCMFGEGFDTILTADCEDNWIVVSRRYSLEPESWSIAESRPFLDYDYIIFPYARRRYTGKWYQRTDARKNILLDENMMFRGSCWVTTKQHLKI